MNSEEWRPVPGYENYEVSNTGRVFSKIKNRELSQQDHNGYCIVDLVGKSGRKHLNVHRLVMLAFVGKPQKGKTDVNHKDGNKKNNNLSNLEYCSRSYNLKHRHHILGYKSPRGKREKCLSDEEIDEIRTMHKSGNYTLKELEEYWNLSHGGFCCIIYRCGSYKNRGTL